MAMILKNGAVFLHIPKTGGCWVTRVLVDSNLVHANFGHIHANYEAFERDWNFWGTPTRVLATHLKSRLPLGAKRAIRSAANRAPEVRAVGQQTRRFFCFVRHPVTWYESFWRYMVMRYGDSWETATDVSRDASHPCHRLVPLGNASFAGFINNVIDHEPGFLTRMYGSFCTSENVIFGHQERLSEDFDRIMRSFGKDGLRLCVKASDPINVTQGTGLETTWTPELKTEILRLEYAVLRKYAY